MRNKGTLKRKEKPHIARQVFNSIQQKYKLKLISSDFRKTFHFNSIEKLNGGTKSWATLTTVQVENLRHHALQEQPDTCHRSG